MNLTLKLRVRIVADFADMQITNFAREYGIFAKTKKLAKMFLPIYQGPR